MKYFTFPMETLNVTQNYLGGTSHLPHTTGNIKDYPIDVAGADGNQSAVFAPVDMKVVAKRGIGNSGVTNTVWLVSTEKVKTPIGETQVFMALTHWNDGDTAMKKWNVGSVVPARDIICYEGKDGATDNHIHMVVGIGYSDNWVANSNGKWVITGQTKKPEELMYIDPNFTKAVKNNGGLNWQNVPQNIGNPVPRNENVNQIQINADNVFARDGVGLNANKLGYINKGIYNSLEFITKDGYDWHHVQDNIWVAMGTWATWLPKKEVEQPLQPPVENPTNDELEQLKEQINALNLQIKDKDEQINALNLQLTEKENIIQELNDKISSGNIEQEKPLFVFKPTKKDKYVIELFDNEELRIYEQ